MTGVWALLTELGAQMPVVLDGDLLRIDGKLHIVENGEPSPLLGNRRERRAYLSKRRRAS